MASDKHQVIVVGAGIIGIATALCLQREGLEVTLVDKGAPAELGASAGNAGLFAVHIARPIGMPGIWKKVPGMLLNSNSPLSVRWPYVPQITPWLLRFLAASNTARVEDIAHALQSLLSHAWTSYAPLIKNAEAENLVIKSGVYGAYRSVSDMEASRCELDLLKRVGVLFEPLSGSKLRDHVGDISNRYQAGIRYPESGYTLEPLLFSRALFNSFIARGGKFLQGTVEAFEQEPSKISYVRISGESHSAESFVCAAGAWSRNLLRSVALKVPLDTERGYNLTVSRPTKEIKAPVILTDVKAAVTPMRIGLRIAGTIEFGGIEAPPTPARYAALARGVESAIPGINMTDASRWMGLRPSMPDSLPIIDRSPVHKNLYLAFGHGHLGLTTAAITGDLIADLVTNRPAKIDLKPFSAGRFGALFTSRKLEK